MVFEELKVRFTGEDGLSGILGRLTGGMGGATKGGLAMGAMFAVVQMAIQAVMKGIQALIKFVQDGIKAYVGFEKGLAEVSTLLSDKSPLEGYSEGLRELALASGESLDTLTKGLYQVISASVDTGAAMDVLTVANKAAIGGLSDTATSVDVITSIMNAYGMSAAEAGRISDYLFTAVKYGKTTFGELASGVGPVITMAASLGVRFDEVAAALATMTRSGIQTTNAVTYLRGMLRSVLKPTSQMKDTAAELGIVFDSTTLKAKGLGGFLKYVSDAVGTNTEALSRLFPNIRGIQAVMALAGKNADAFAGDLEHMTESAGATEAAFTTMADTTSFKLGKMQAEIRDTQLEIGEKMVPASLLWQKVMLALAGAVGWLIDIVLKLVGVFKPLFDALGSIFGSMGEGLNIVEILGAGFDLLIVILTKLAEYVGGAIKIAFAIFKTVIGWIIDRFTDLWNLLKPLVDFLAGVFGPAIDAIIGVIKGLIDVIKGVVDWLGNAWSAMGNWADSVIHGTEAVSGLEEAMGHTDEEIKDMAASLSEAARRLEELDTNILTATNEIKVLTDANEELVREIERLSNIKILKDDLDLLKRSTEDAAYAQQIFDDELRIAQIELLQTEGLLAGLKESMDEYGDITKKNNLEIMKIRYKARKENRELTEDEEKLIEELELANEELRIKIQEEAIKVDDIEEDALRSQKDRVEERKRALEDEKAALEGQAKTEIEKLQETVDANKLSITTKLQDIKDWAIERETVQKTLNDILTDLQNNYNADELKDIETQSGLKLDEIDDFIYDSELKWFNHYKYLKELWKTYPGPGEPDGAPTEPEEPEKPIQYRVGSSIPVPINRLRVRSTSGLTKFFQYDTPSDAIKDLLGKYRFGQPLSWQYGGYVPKTTEALLHPGEYVLPKKIVDLLDFLVSRPPSPAQVLARERPTPISPSPVLGTTDMGMHFYGDIHLHGVQDVDALMEELHRRARIAGGRL